MKNGKMRKTDKQILETPIIDKKKKLICGCGQKGRLIIACKECCPSEHFDEYKEESHKKTQGANAHA